MIRFGRVLLATYLCFVGCIGLSCSKNEGDYVYIGIVASSHSISAWINEEPVLVNDTGQFIEEISLFVREGRNRIQVEIRDRISQFESSVQIVVFQGPSLFDGKVLFESGELGMTESDIIRIDEPFYATDLPRRSACLLERADPISNLSQGEIKEGILPVISAFLDAYEKAETERIQDYLYSADDCKWEDDDYCVVNEFLRSEDVVLEFDDLSNLDFHVGHKTALVVSDRGYLLHAYQSGSDDSDANAVRIFIEKLWFFKANDAWYLLD